MTFIFKNEHDKKSKIIAMNCFMVDKKKKYLFELDTDNFEIIADARNKIDEFFKSKTMKFLIFPYNTIRLIEN